VGFSFAHNKYQAIGMEASRSIMATPNISHPAKIHTGHKLPINVDLVAVVIGLTLAALIRFGVIHQITF
jgi:hypothetical protein